MGEDMKILITAICTVIVFGISDYAETGSISQKDVVPENVAPSVEETAESNPDEIDSDEIAQVPSALIPAVMIDGTIYYLSQGYPIPDNEVNLDRIDYTESEIPLNTYPEKDGESNYAPAGTAYVKHENGYALKMEKYGWSLFLTWEDRLAEE